MKKESEVRLSMKEHERRRVLEEVRGGHRSQVSAGRLLGLTDRWIRELLDRYQRRGAIGLIHGNRNRPSNRSISEKERRAIVRLYREKYEDFNLTHFREMLQEREKKPHPPCRETLRQMLRAEGLWERRRDGPRHRMKRPRREHEGELLQMDASIHAWLGEDLPSLALVGAIDDATGDLPHAEFFGAETTEAYFKVIGEIIRKRGIPGALYTDRDSVFTVNNVKEIELVRAQGRRPETQFGRALRELSIEWIPAYSPQAKGRIERLWGTFQDRLLNELRLEKIRTREEANRYLSEKFLPSYNRRFRCVPTQPESMYRPAPLRRNLEAALCWKESRVLGRDHTFSFEKEVWQVLPSQKRIALSGRRMEVRKTLRGFVEAWYGSDRLSLRPAPKAVVRTVSEKISQRPKEVTGARARVRL